MLFYSTFYLVLPVFLKQITADPQNSIPSISIIGYNGVMISQHGIGNSMSTVMKKFFTRMHFIAKRKLF